MAGRQRQFGLRHPGLVEQRRRSARGGDGLHDDSATPLDDDGRQREHARVRVPRERHRPVRGVADRRSALGDLAAREPRARRVHATADQLLVDERVAKRQARL